MGLLKRTEAAIAEAGVLTQHASPSLPFSITAALVFAMQCAGVALAVQHVGCDFERNPVPDAAACRGESFLAALAVPNVPGYDVFDDVVLVLSGGLVWAITVAVGILLR